jgi:hypothetical protein
VDESLHDSIVLTATGGEEKGLFTFLEFISCVFLWLFLQPKVKLCVAKKIVPKLNSSVIE